MSVPRVRPKKSIGRVWQKFISPAHWKTSKPASTYVNTGSEDSLPREKISLSEQNHRKRDSHNSLWLILGQNMTPVAMYAFKNVKANIKVTKANIEVTNGANTSPGHGVLYCQCMHLDMMIMIMDSDGSALASAASKALNDCACLTRHQCITCSASPLKSLPRPGNVSMFIVHVSDLHDSTRRHTR